MEDTIDHHGLGVKMAELCVAKATIEELRDLCDDIAPNQSNEMIEMQDSLKSWYGKDKQPTMTPAMQRELDGLARLSGTRFDVAISRAFIRHHRIQVLRSSREVRAYHDELKDL